MKITQLRRIIKEQIENHLNDQLPPPKEIRLNKLGNLVSDDEDKFSDGFEFDEEADAYDCYTQAIDDAEARDVKHKYRDEYK